MQERVAAKTISLQKTAYEKLKAAKRPGENFSDTILRILGPREPSLLEFTRLLDRKTAERVADAIARMRAEDPPSRSSAAPPKRAT